MGSRDSLQLLKETIRFSNLVGVCVKCKGKYRYRPMPGSTTCLKHKAPARRNVMREMMFMAPKEMMR